MLALLLFTSAAAAGEEPLGEAPSAAVPSKFGVGGPTASKLWLSLAYRQRDEARAWQAVLGFTLPFAAFFESGSASIARSGSLAEPPEPKSTRRTPRRAEADAVDAPSPAAAAELPAAKGASSAPDARVDAASRPPAAPRAQRERPEPATAVAAPRLTPALIQAAVQAALRAFAQGAPRERLLSLAARAKSSALLPELRLGAGRSRDESLRFSPTIADPERYTAAGAADLWLEARLSWRLDRLVFAGEELNVERLLAEHARAKHQRIQQLIGALFSWQKALTEAAEPGVTPAIRQLAQLRALHAASEVDALTAGWFFKQGSPL